jgi:hypothetical protein
MSWLVTKDGVSVSADTEADLRLAIACLTTPQADCSLGSVHLPVEINAPAWRVGGPPDSKPLPPIEVRGQYVTADQLAELEEDKPVLTLVSESDDSVAESPTVQHVPVRAILLDVLNAILLFPEGVESRGVAELLGLTDKSIGNRIQRLKGAGLVEKVPHHRQWRATQLARRAKLVKC